MAELSAPCASYQAPDITPALSPLYPQLINLDCPPGETDKWVTELQVEVSTPS